MEAGNSPGENTCKDCQIRSHRRVTFSEQEPSVAFVQKKSQIFFDDISMDIADNESLRIEMLDGKFEEDLEIIIGSTDAMADSMIDNMAENIRLMSPEGADGSNMMMVPAGDDMRVTSPDGTDADNEKEKFGVTFPKLSSNPFVQNDKGRR